MVANVGSGVSGTDGGARVSDVMFVVPGSTPGTCAASGGGTASGGGLDAGGPGIDRPDIGSVMVWSGVADGPPPNHLEIAPPTPPAIWPHPEGAPEVSGVEALGGAEGGACDGVWVAGGD